MIIEAFSIGSYFIGASIQFLIVGIMDNNAFMLIIGLLMVAAGAIDIYSNAVGF